MGAELFDVICLVSLDAILLRDENATTELDIDISPSEIATVDACRSILIGLLEHVVLKDVLVVCTGENEIRLEVAGEEIPSAAKEYIIVFKNVQAVDVLGNDALALTVVDDFCWEYNALFG